jgi:hypothetical protein
MRRLRQFFFLILLVTLIACTYTAPSFTPDVTHTPSATRANQSGSVLRNPTAESTPSSTALPAVPGIVDRAVTTPTPSADSAPSAATDHGIFSVRTHPDGPLYVGDLVSLSVIAEVNIDLREYQLQVETEDGSILGSAEFNPFGIGQRNQATLTWVWDTSSLDAGDHRLSFSLIPGGERWTETFSLQPASELPYPEPEATWASAQTDCCMIHYISGTAAERDLEEVLAAVDDQYEHIANLMVVELDEPLTFTILPRVLGHGGFASNEVAVSYLDRNYAGSTLDFVLGHEIIHKMDENLGGDLRPTILVEGLAVYLNGGHFKPEPLMERAAALLPPVEGCQPVDPTLEMAINGKNAEPCGLDMYIPLADLSDDFYLSQHEIGYLQAGALVEFMVETWGWKTYNAFYRSVHPLDAQDEEARREYGFQGSAIDQALQDHFGITLAVLENQFVAALQEQDLTEEQVNDVHLTVDFYNTLRRYQQALDSSAYFLTAWLLDGEQMRERGIVADYLRQPVAPENLALETMLVHAETALRAGDHARVAQLLRAANTTLEALEDQIADPFQGHSLAADYMAIVQLLSATGYQAQNIEVAGALAKAWVTINSTSLVELSLVHTGQGWEFSQVAQ